MLTHRRNVVRAATCIAAAATLSIATTAGLAAVPSIEAAAAPNSDLQTRDLLARVGIAANGLARRVGETIAPTANDKQLTLYWGMARNDAGAEQRLNQVSKPGSKRYRHFLTEQKIISKFGATEATVRAVRQILAGTGLGFELDGSRLFARVSGPTGTFNSLFGAGLVDISLGTGETITLPGGPSPVLPDALKGLIKDPVWTQVTMAGPAVRSRLLPEPGNEGRWIDGCKKAQQTNAYSFAQLAKAYGADELQRASGGGAQTRAGIVSLGEGFSAHNAAVAARCFGWKMGKNKVVLADGLSGPLAGGGEGDLDLQMLRAMLPETGTVSIFQQSSFAPLWFLSYVNAFNSDHRPDVLTTSYGLCEPTLFGEGIPGAEQGAALLEATFVRLGLAGTSMLFSTGDYGSSPCTQQDPGATVKSVEYPSSSPWVTAVGGSRIVLNKDNTRKDEKVWNDTNYRHGIGSGTGGLSAVFTKPSYQKNSITDQSTRYRAVPDVVAHSSGAPAWAIYTQDSFGNSGWQSIWGTSAATPFLASSIAMIDAQQRTAGRSPLGFLNPWLYSSYQRNPSRYFDVTAGNNDIDHVGCCTATKGFDLASGLGAPKINMLRQAIAPPG